MPNRLLKESICTSENIDALSAFVETVFYRLIVNCDDYGRLDARPKLLASKLYPLRDMQTEQIENALRELASAELIHLYNVGGKPFLQIVTWERHQQVRAKKSKFPSPDSADKVNESEKRTHDSACNQLISDDCKCPRNPILSESNPNTNTNTEKNARAKRFTPPTVDDVMKYAEEAGHKIDAQRFVDFYASKGWVVGNSPMKDWRAAVRNWCKRDAVQAGNAFAPAQRVGKQVGAQQYTQRDYTEEYLDSTTIELLEQARQL